MLSAACCLAATSPAFAQDTRPGEVMGMRYLSWSGKAAAPVDGLRRSTATPAALVPVDASVAGSRYPGIQVASRPSRYGAGSAGLTPASAWTNAPPAAPPVANPPMPDAHAAMQASASPPVGPRVDPAAQAQAQAEYQAQIQSQYQAWYQSEAQAQYEAQVRATPQPQQQAGQAVAGQAPARKVEAQQPAQPRFEQRAEADAVPVADPMAPRRDAPIFRMQQPQSEAQAQSAPQQAASNPGEIASPVLTQPVAGRTPSGQAYAGAEPPRESARYYSVHRAEGRQPDPISMPESVYLDNAPIDLAEPPAAPVSTRTVNGRAQVVVPNQDPSLP